MSTHERLNKLQAAISKPSFLEDKGLGNEIGFYIFDYPPRDELIVREWLENQENQNKQGISNYSICNIDLFTCVTNILDEKGFLDKTFVKEERRGTENLIKPITTTIRLNEEESLVIKHILSRVKSNDILFLTGTGKVWPIISSHSILNKLHHHIDKNPVVLFFPGKYSKEDLKLFGYIGGDGETNYYRAFKIVD